MYKYEYLFDADRGADTYRESRTIATVELLENWINDPTCYILSDADKILNESTCKQEESSFLDILRINEMKQKQEREAKWNHFWNKRGSHPIEANPELAH